MKINLFRVELGKIKEKLHKCQAPSLKVERSTCN